LREEIILKCSAPKGTEPKQASVTAKLTRIWGISGVDLPGGDVKVMQIDAKSQLSFHSSNQATVMYSGSNCLYYAFFISVITRGGKRDVAWTVAN
jgi:hypothetical protein